MASIWLEPPGHFNFKNHDEWQRWKKRFEQYCTASGLAEEGEPRQVSTFLYCMGKEADNLLRMTGISDADRAEYSKVVKKFDDFYKVWTNIIYKQAQFNRRNQQDGESVEQYITILHWLW